MDHVTLLSGNHETREQGVCVMEAVAWFADEPHSDRPQCACSVASAFARELNDWMGDEDRQRLKPLIPALALSKASWPVTLKRAFIASDYAVRVFAPLGLEARGYHAAASKLRALVPITDRQSAARAVQWAAGAARAAAEAAEAAWAAEAARAAAEAARAAGAAGQQLVDLGIECLEKMLAVTD